MPLDLAPTSASVLALGLIVGIRHSFEADHMAAVSTLVTEHRSSLRAALLGALWGLGHSISLMITGMAVLLLQLRIPARVALSLEFAVALMLLLLGGRALFRGGRLHGHGHTHGPHIQHVHLHVHDAASGCRAEAHHRLPFGSGALLVGAVHGLAGSGAVMLLVLSTIASPLLGLAYIALFGVGSTGGMMLMSTLVSLPAQFAADRFDRLNSALHLLAAALSIGIGLAMVYEIGLVERLLL